MRLIEQATERVAQAAEAAQRASEAVARLEARKVDLEINLVAEREALSAAEVNAIAARLSGDGDASGEVARLRERVTTTGAALAELTRQAEAAAIAAEAARAAHASAQKIEASLVVAAALRERGGQAIEALAALFQVPGSREHGAVQIISEALGQVEHSPDRATARIEEAARNIEARAAAHLGPAEPPVTPSPPCDVLIYAKRSFRYRFRDGENLHAPSGFVGHVPAPVADRLAALSAGKRLEAPSRYLANEDIELPGRAYIDKGRAVVLLESTARALVADGKLTAISAVTDADEIRAAHGLSAGDQSFSGALDLGLIDAPPSTVSAAASESDTETAPKPRARRQLVRAG